jgi:hypothetical protein
VEGLEGMCGRIDLLILGDRLGDKRVLVFMILAQAF